VSFILNMSQEVS